MEWSRAGQGCMRGEGCVQGVSAATATPATAAHTAPAAAPIGAIAAAVATTSTAPAMCMPACCLTCWLHVHLPSLPLADWLPHLLTGLALHLLCVCPPAVLLAGHMYTYPPTH